MKNKTIIISALVIAVLIIAVFALKHFLAGKPDYTGTTLDIPGTEEKYVYNGFTFAKAGGLWYTQVQAGTKLYNIVLHFSPKELLDIPSEGANSPDFFDSDSIYITFDPLEPELQYLGVAVSEVSLNMARVWNIKPIAACTVNETETCAKRPIITCANTDGPTIYFKQSNVTGVLADGNCITIQGRGYDLIKAGDRFIYNVYGIM